MGATLKERALVLVKAFPQPSQTYDETVCCAGITPAGAFVRLYPIRYRQLPKEKQFVRWDVIEYEAAKPKGDHRPESRHVNEESIRIVQLASQVEDEERVRLWAPHISLTLAELKAKNLAEECSLGIVRPDVGTVRFSAKKLSFTEAKARVAEFKQVSLLGESAPPELSVEYDFLYKFGSGGNKHEMRIHDWEVQAAYLNFKRLYRSEAVDRLRDVYETQIPMRNLHLVMGTMLGHPRTFIVIGLLRSGTSPADAMRQGALL